MAVNAEATRINNYRESAKETSGQNNSHQSPPSPIPGFRSFRAFAISFGNDLQASQKLNVTVPVPEPSTALLALMALAAVAFGRQRRGEV